MDPQNDNGKEQPNILVNLPLKENLLVFLPSQNINIFQLSNLIFDETLRSGKMEIQKDIG